MMTIGKAVAIFERIGSFKLQDDVTDQEKIEAIEDGSGEDRSD